MKSRNISDAEPKALRELIEAAGLNQTSAAQKLGITSRAVRHYLAGTRRTPAVVILAMKHIAKAKK